LIHFVVAFPTSHQAPVISKPGNGALNFPASFVPSQSPSILKFWFVSVNPVRGYQFNALFLENLAKAVRIIRLVTNQMLGFLTKLIKGLVCQFHLMRAGRVKGHSQRNTLAVCHHHKLCALAPLGFADFRPPFLAGMKLPSMKHSAHLICLFLSNSWIKVLQTLSHISFSSHIFKRLQQVLGLGYFSGKSFQRAPVRKIQRIPSKTKRLCFQGLPLLFNLGSSGSIFCHCLSVRYTARLIGAPPINHCIKERYQCL